MKHTPFITVEGPIGVGKTTLAQAIANHLDYKLLKEIVDENPFLGKFMKISKNGASKQRCFSSAIVLNS